MLEPEYLSLMQSGEPALCHHKFAANSQPYYIVLDNDGRALSPSYGYDENIPRFKQFLDDALEAYAQGN